MVEGAFLHLVHNAALLLAMALLYDVSTTRWALGRAAARQVPVGLVLGGIGMALMLTPWSLEPGILFDTRSVLLGVSGLFFGTVPTVIAMAITVALRIVQGGAAALTGVLVILASGAVGLAWRHLRRRPLAEVSWSELFGLGYAVHATMLALMFTLPVEAALKVLSHIALPVLTIYPVGTAVLGALMANRLRREAATGALRESESRFRAFFDQAAVGVALVDSATGRFLEVNERYAEMVGYGHDELAKLDFASITHAADLDEDLGRMEELRAGRIREFSMEKRYFRKDGSTIWVTLSVSPMWAPGANPTTHIAVVQDITARKTAEESLKAASAERERLLEAADRSRRALLSLLEDRKAAEEEIRRLNADLERRVAKRTEQLEASNRELESFSYSVSHDLRAPLRAIDGFSGKIAAAYGARLDEEGRRLLDVVRRNALKMGRLIDDLLAFSRLNRADVRRSRVDMGDLARAAFAEVAGDLSRKDRIAFTVGDLPEAWGDPSLLRQVWLNLLSNAVKFSARSEKPVVEVTGGLEGGVAVYRVRDNGVGFDMAYAAKLFGVFQRLHGMTEFEGTGVGLALVHRILARHRGWIRAEGSLGAGATFTFGLPLERDVDMTGPRERPLTRAVEPVGRA
jgi:PAS domain S-box-containing protein